MWLNWRNFYIANKCLKSKIDEKIIKEIIENQIESVFFRMYIKWKRPMSWLIFHKFFNRSIRFGQWCNNFSCNFTLNRFQSSLKSVLAMFENVQTKKKQHSGNKNLLNTTCDMLYMVQCVWVYVVICCDLCAAFAVVLTMFRCFALISNQLHKHKIGLNFNRTKSI